MKKLDDAVLAAADAWASAVLASPEAFNVAGQVLIDAINQRRLALATRTATHAEEEQ